MTATTEEMGRFMEMFTKAMVAMAEKEKDDRTSKAERKIFDKEFMKDAREFSGDKMEYNEWSYKWHNQMESSSEKFVEIIDKAVKLEDKFCIDDLEGMDGKASSTATSSSNGQTNCTMCWLRS